MDQTFWKQEAEPAGPKLPVFLAMRRGASGHCPACGEAPAFRGYLKVVPACAACGALLGTARVDDAPPYFTIIIVGHIIVPSIVVWVRFSAPPSWLLLSIFLPVTLVLTMVLLRPVKGALLGIHIALRLFKRPGQPH